MSSHAPVVDPLLMANQPQTPSSEPKPPKSFNLLPAQSAMCELAGHKLACLVNPFILPRTALKVGVMYRMGRDADIGMDVEEIPRYLEFFDAILIHVPWLEQELFKIDSRELTAVTNKLTSGMSEQRLMDLSSVKHAGLAYIPLDMKKLFALDPPLPKTEDKSKRGFFHPGLAKLLCPQKKRQTFDEDPEFMMAAIQDGSIRVTEYMWPSYFYEDGVYDPEDRSKGLFHGHIAWRFYVHLFIGPSAATNGTVKSMAAKKSKNRA